jgi:hypothetical protein
MCLKVKETHANTRCHRLQQGGNAGVLVMFSASELLHQRLSDQSFSHGSFAVTYRVHRRG